eukprot:4202998-Lingulodinium_polyedra.AAC.1
MQERADAGRTRARLAEPGRPNARRSAVRDLLRRPNAIHDGGPTWKAPRRRRILPPLARRGRPGRVWSAAAHAH